MVREFYDLQKLRVATSNRLERFKSDPDALKVMEHLFADLEKHEAALELKVKQAIRGVSIYRRFLSGITGCGPLLSACLVSEIGRIHKEGEGIAAFSKPSKLIKCMGIAPREAYADHKYNWFLKSKILGEQGLIDQFILHRHGFAYDKYVELKAHMRNKYPEKSKRDDGKWQHNDGHIHNMAKKELANMFLIHLWQKWRTLEGLPVTNPYVQAILGHSGIVSDPNVWIDKPDKLLE